jgi:hypothetical protein
MTQEELDALMNGGVDLESEESPQTDDNTTITENETEETGPLDPKNSDGIYPPPATDDHKVVSQLDEVTKESEE